MSKFGVPAWLREMAKGSVQMKLIHRVSPTPNASQREILSSLGLQLIESTSPLVRLVTFEVEESEPSWPRAKALIEECKAADFVRTEFTKSEFDAASFLQILAMQKGYPQPNNDFGYRHATFDLANYCSACGMGKTQVAPFRMKGEPKWGKLHICQLHWVYDEFFVLPKVWESVFRPRGIGCREVLDHRSGKPLQNVVQLVTNDIAPSPLAISEHAFEACQNCSRKKYLPISRGYFPVFLNNPGRTVCRTQEVFGSGASAWNATVITKNLYAALQQQKLAGASFVPLST